MAFGGSSTLRYLESSFVHGPAGNLGQAEIRTSSGRKLGDLDGVLVDPPARRLRYYVVRRPGWFNSRYFLLPASQPAQICRVTRTLRIDIDPEELRACPAYEGRSVPSFSDHDLLDSIFRRQVA